MKVKMLALVLSLFFFDLSFAQLKHIKNQTDFSIRGTVVDSNFQNNLSNVTIEINEAPGKTKEISSIVTNAKGYFEIGHLPNCKLQFTFSHIGYRTKIIQVPLLSSTFLNLGRIELVSLAKELSEVQVIAQVPVLEQTIEKIIYHVDADPESNILSAFELLQKIPMLTIDAEDNLQLNGNSNYTIFVNGRRSSLFAFNKNDIFKSLAANNIKTIEVIAIPRSNYEASGAGGIINIITYKKALGGYTGAITVKGTLPKGHTSNGNISATFGKFSFSANAGYSFFTNPLYQNRSSRLDKLSHAKLEQSEDAVGNHKALNNGGEISWSWNDQNTLSTGYMRNAGHSIATNNQSIKFYDKSGQSSGNYQRVSNSKTNQGSEDVDISYRYSSKKNEAQQLTLSARRSTASNTSNNQFLRQALGIPNESSASNNHDAYTEQSFSGEYFQPLKKHSLEFGIYTGARKSSSSYSYQTQDSSNVFNTDSNQNNLFTYRENIYASFVSLNLAWKQFGFRTDLRVEISRLSGHFLSSQLPANRNFNLIPTSSIYYKLGMNSIVKLTYSQRISRADLSYLDPFIDISDQWNIRYGNPALQPALAHLFNLSLNSSMKKTSFTVNLFHQFTNNAVQQFTMLGTDSITRTTYGNIGQNKNFSLSASTSTSLLPFLNLSLNGNINNVQYSSSLSGKPINNKGITYSFFGFINYRTKGWRFQSNLGYNSPAFYLQGKTASYLSNRFSINKQFLKNSRGNIGFTVSDPFNRYRTNRTDLEDNSFYLARVSHFDIRKWGLSLTYRFSKLQAVDH